MKATLTVVFALGSILAGEVTAQSPLVGFWVRTGITCLHLSEAICARLPNGHGAEAAQLAIDVGGNLVIVAGPELAFAIRADTFRVDGRGIRWLPGHRGIFCPETAPPKGYCVGDASRVLGVGESWTVSADDHTLTHKFAPRVPGDSTLIVFTYHRAVDGNP